LYDIDWDMTYETSDKFALDSLNEGEEPMETTNDVKEPLFKLLWFNS